MEAPEQGIERLHHFVTERRRALGISRAQMFARGEAVTLDDEQSPHRGPGVVSITLERIDRALGWAPGSAGTVMSGGAHTSRIPAPSDAACPAHEHVVTVLESIRTQLHTAEQLVEDAQVGHAR